MSDKRRDKIVFYSSRYLQIDVVWSDAATEPWREQEWDVWILFDERSRWLQLPKPITFDKKPTNQQLRVAVMRHIKAWSKSLVDELPNMKMTVLRSDDAWDMLHNTETNTEKVVHDKAS